MKSQKQREAERRRKKLEEVQRQVESGSLTIRQMTPKERKENQPREPAQKKRRR